MLRPVLFLFLLALLPVAQAESLKEVEAGVRATLYKNLKSLQIEDMDMMMTTIHTQSPFYQSTRQAVEPLLKQYKLKYEFISEKFIGYDGDLAYIRVVQKTSKISGPEFNDNIIDMVQGYRKENNTWKIWAQFIVDIKYL